MSIFLLAAIPLILAILSFLLPDARKTGLLVAIGSWFHLGMILFITRPVIFGHDKFVGLLSGFLLDQPAAWFLILTAAVAACSFSQAYLLFAQDPNTLSKGFSRRLKVFYVCACLFLLAMSFVFICDNLGYLWISIEATTLLSAPLVYFTRTKHALEATWKYFIICSVGIAFSLLGTIFVYASSQDVLVTGGALNIFDLTKAATQINYSFFRLGFIFCFLGYGTKAGIFPLHSWLPDAHSEAPAPISAMLSGSLLNCALFGIWRLSSIDLACHKNNISQELAIWAGTLTVVAASFFLVRQHGLKRLWAYSSIENVGLMLVAIGTGSPALFILQAVNHSLAKVSLFLLSGNIVHATGFKELHEIKGLLKFAPSWGILLVLSAFAITGVPPFGSFVSEWLILAKSMQIGVWQVVPLLIFGLSLSFVAVCAHVGRILVGTPKTSERPAHLFSTSLVPFALVLCSFLLGILISPALLGIAL